ncbi:MAG: hypothetical protein JNM63_15860 [Spirochaetia bacterium]|nr:hypothetical protein [Spirochaetia bacterium]
MGLVFFKGPLSAEETVPEFLTAEAEAKQIVEYAAQADFAKAFKACDTLRARYPDSPFGHVLSTFTYSIFINYYKSTNYLDNLLQESKLAEDQLATLIKNKPEDKSYRFLMGGTLGYRGMLEVAQGKILGAMATGIRAVDNLQFTIRKDPVIYDSYFGLSLFYFYRGYFSKVFSWIPAYNDDQKKAYDYLMIARERGTLTRHEALFRFFSFSVIDKKWQGLETWVHVEKDRFPRNMYLNYVLLDLYRDQEAWSKIPAIASDAIAILKREPLAGKSAYFMVNTRLAAAHLGMNKLAEADALLSNLEKQIPTLEPWANNSRYIDEVRKLRRDLKQKISKK